MKILLATDGSEYSLAAARKSVELIALGEHSTVRVVSVVEPIAPTAPFGVADEYYIQAQNAAREAAETDVKEASELIRNLTGEVDVDVEAKVFTGRPKEAVVTEAAEWGADLIVVGSHGRGFWGRMMLGSVSSAVVKHAECSVLVVRSDSEE